MFAKYVNVLWLFDIIYIAFKKQTFTQASTCLIKKQHEKCGAGSVVLVFVILS